MKVHPNSVSAAYQDLAARGWVKGQAGSGVFVREIENRAGKNGIDTFLRAWMEEGQGRGFTLDAMGSTFKPARADFRAHGKARMLVVIQAPGTA